MKFYQTEQVRPDCRHYRGLKPCGRAEDCAGCAGFEPLGQRILIVKLGALGDVLRTTPLLRGLKKEQPRAEITWLTDRASAELLRGNPLVDRLWLTGSESLARLGVEEFDRLICLDKEPTAVACATLARARVKQGFGMNEKGRVVPFNKAAVENLRLGLSDELKFRQNRKTYQQLAFETAELAYDPSLDYVFHLAREDRDWAGEFLARRLEGGPEIIIGFNLGGADVFANKRWKMSRFLELRGLIRERWGERAAILGFGGPGDRERLERAEALSGGGIVNTGANPLSRFAALLSRCDLLITGDSLGMHLCLAVGGRVLVLIGSTTPRELELYGRGRMIVSELPCAPCYKRTCPVSPDCMESFSAVEVMAGLEALLGDKK